MDESLLNFSRVEEDPFAKVPLESNITESPFIEINHVHVALNYIFFACEFVNFFLGIAAVVSDVLIIYFVFRYKRLRKNFNLYIANFAIANLLYFAIAPIVLVAHILLSFVTSYVFCYISMIEYTFLTSSFVFATLMGLEWTLMCDKPDLPNRIPWIFKYKYPILYALIAFLLIFSGAGCLFRYELVQGVLYYLMPFITIALIYMHYVRRKRVLNKDQLKTEYALWVCTIGAGCFVPIYFLDLILSFIGPYAYHTFILLIFLCEYILSFLSIPSPVYILYYLLKWDKHFKMAFDTTFKRSVRTYGADNLDDASDNEEIIEDNRQKNMQVDGNGLSRAEIMVP